MRIHHVVGLEDKRTNNDNAFNPTKLSSPLQLSNVSSHNASPLEWLRGRLKTLGRKDCVTSQKRAREDTLSAPSRGFVGQIVVLVSRFDREFVKTFLFAAKMAPEFDFVQPTLGTRLNFVFNEGLRLKNELLREKVAQKGPQIFLLGKWRDCF